MPRVEVKGRVVDFPDNLKGDDLNKAVSSAASQFPDDDPTGRNYREALETTGMLAGGALGGGVGTAAEPGLGTTAGAVGGAALGRSTGTAAANFIDYLRGKQKKTLPEQVKEEAGSAVSGAEAEMGGQVGGKLIQGAAKAVPVAGKAFLEGIGQLTTGKPGMGRVLADNPGVTAAGYFTNARLSQLGDDIGEAIKSGRSKIRGAIEGMGASLAKEGKTAPTKPVFDAMDSLGRAVKLEQPLHAVRESDAKTVGQLIQKTREQLSDVVDASTARSNLDAAAENLGKKGFVDNTMPLRKKFATEALGNTKTLMGMPPRDQGQVMDASKKILDSLNTVAPMDQAHVSDLLKVRHTLDDTLMSVHPKSQAAKVLSSFRNSINDVIFNKAPDLKPLDDQLTSAMTSDTPVVVPKENVDPQTLLTLRHRLDDEINYAHAKMEPVEAHLSAAREKIDNHIAQNFPQIKPVDRQYKDWLRAEKSLVDEYGVIPNRSVGEYSAKDQAGFQSKIVKTLEKHSLPRQTLSNIDQEMGTDFLKRAEQLSATAPVEAGGKPAFESFVSPGSGRRLGYMLAGGGGASLMFRNPAIMAIPVGAAALTSPPVMGAALRTAVPVGQAISSAAEQAYPAIPPLLKALISRRKTQQETQ